jgi:hypothetical protein
MERGWRHARAGPHLALLARKRNLGHALLYPAHMAQRDMGLYGPLFYGRGITTNQLSRALFIIAFFHQQ